MNKITGGDVLEMLIPTGGWVITADDFDSICYDEGVAPITKEQYEAGFAQYNAWKSEQNAAQAIAKAAAQAKLASLGLTTEDLQVLGLGGN